MLGVGGVSIVKCGGMLRGGRGWRGCWGRGGQTDEVIFAEGVAEAEDPGAYGLDYFARLWGFPFFLPGF